MFSLSNFAFRREIMTGGNPIESRTWRLVIPMFSIPEKRMAPSTCLTFPILRNLLHPTRHATTVNNNPCDRESSCQSYLHSGRTLERRPQMRTSAIERLHFNQDRTHDRPECTAQLFAKLFPFGRTPEVTGETLEIPRVFDLDLNLGH